MTTSEKKLIYITATFFNSLVMARLMKSLIVVPVEAHTLLEQDRARHAPRTGFLRNKELLINFQILEQRKQRKSAFFFAESRQNSLKANFSAPFHIFSIIR
jgi:hypothetical protein